MTATIYLHWTATPYDWIRPGHYHSIIGGDGRVHRLHAYNVDLPAHTYGRNRNSVALSCACMGGVPDPWTQPPTEAQLNSLCIEAADVALGWGWGAELISVKRVMTHAEAASNRDGRWMHDNYGPVIWGGTGERWDLLQLKKNGPIDGGEQLRHRIQALMRRSGAGTQQGALEFRGTTRIQARGRDLSVQLDALGRSWALAADLLERYELPFTWDTSSRRVLISALDVSPTFREDGVQAEVGWPLFEMALQSNAAPVILRGIIRSHHNGERAWCRVVEFAEEFGISLTFDPLRLGERRGG